MRSVQALVTVLAMRSAPVLMMKLAPLLPVANELAQAKAMKLVPRSA